MAIFEFLNHIDQQVLLFINGLHCSFFDPIMWRISTIGIWIPLYIVLIFFMIKERKWNFLLTLLAIAMMMLLSDQGSNQIKEYVQRLRPTHDLVIGSMVHHLHNYLGGPYGFVSSHAANSFAVASFTSLFFKRRWFTISIFCWAALVSYSRMYLGVHYPLDILCGGLLGFASGTLMYHTEQWGQHKYGRKLKKEQQQMNNAVNQS